jgi:hypothetical protein
MEKNTEIDYERAHVIKPGRPIITGEEVMLESMSFTKEHGLEIEAKHPGVMVIAEELVKMFVDLGGENYVELELNHEKLGHFTLTLQRKDGATPCQTLAIAQARLTEAKKIIEDLLPFAEDKAIPLFFEPKLAEAACTINKKISRAKAFLKGKSDV